MNAVHRGWQWLRACAAIHSTLARIEGKVDNLMVSENDLQTDMDAIKALVQKQADTIAQLVAGQPVSQAQLDALDAEAKAILGIGAGSAPAAS